ncbi:hypothetical protein DICSQDRAFT_144286 [Dichomitus squalens LYAD-421 SS1]|uniref:uncharacterized protein n=1 Tax=Dichomitus squalens (strain LYAD-421) TaxID=732165 RepID=UPI00044148DA|nr:uncharacterized protein DICSQDRAFT_144286 [Dichomitus squalens LYAD-421 SS1]EJF64521.1 hypothetical protein DICSQDRAFT_144286 [Dichomitus squalens LYAD-421 SS1]
MASTQNVQGDYYRVVRGFCLLSRPLYRPSKSRSDRSGAPGRAQELMFPDLHLLLVSPKRPCGGNSCNSRSIIKFAIPNPFGANTLHFPQGM